MASNQNLTINATGAPLDGDLGSGDDYEQICPADGSESGIAWEISIFLVMAILIVLVNAFVILLVTRKSVLRTASNHILVSLAISDLLMGAFGIPFVFLSSVGYREVNVPSALFIKFVSFSTMAHILLHTCDRYVYILRAMRYEELVYPRRVYTILAIAWMTTLLASFIRLIWVTGIDFETADDEVFDAMEEKERIYNIFSFAFFFCLPLIVITSMDIHMMCVVHKQSKLISQQHLPSELRKQSTKLLVGRKRKTVLTCIIILTVYVACWLPYSLLEWFQRPGDCIKPWLLWCIYNIRFLSSVCNPWLYTLRKHDLRKAALRWNRKTFPCLVNHRRRRQNRMRRTSRNTGTTELIVQTSTV